MSASHPLLQRADELISALTARLPPPLDQPRVRFRLQAGAAIALIVSFFVILLLFFNLLAPLNRLATDLLYHALPLHPQVALIVIDKKSLDEIGTFPWARALHAELLSRSRKLPRVIAFDLVFAPPSPDDAKFAQEISRSGNVLLVAGAEEGAALPTKMEELPEYQPLVVPDESLRSAAKGVGHRIVIPDADNITRQLPTGIRSGNNTLTALGLIAAANYLGIPNIQYNLPERYAALNALRIPTDEYGNTLLNFTSPSSGALTYSYVDVLDGTIPAQVFADKLVFVGGNSTIESTQYAIPLQLGEARTYNVNLQADLASLLLSQPPRTLQTQAALAQVGLILAMALLAGLTLPHLRPLYAVALTLVYLVGLLLYAFDVFNHGILVQILYPALALLLTATSIVMFRYLSEDRRRHFLTLLFRRYVPAESVGQVLDAVDSGELPLTGTRRIVTVLYADLRGFASMSDEMTPQVVLETVNRYLELALQAISAQGGTVSKPMGDALIAIWNAPLDQSDHRARGLRAAVDIRRTILEYQQENEELEPLTLGIGLATGYAVLGNVSALGKVEYTLVGDTVNVAARISAFANNNQILADTDTAHESPEEFVVRELSPVRVRGRKEPLPVWDVRELNPQAATEDQEE